MLALRFRLSKFPLPIFIHVLRPAYFVAPPARQYRGVLPILSQERIHRALGGHQVVERPAVLLEPAHGLGYLRDNALRHGRQGTAQRIRQPAFIELSSKLRLTQFDQQVDQGLVAIRLQLKQSAVHFGAIFRSGRKQLAGTAHGFDQRILWQRVAE